MVTAQGGNPKQGENDGNEESNQETKEGQEAAADEEPRDRRLEKAILVRGADPGQASGLSGVGGGG